MAKAEVVIKKFDKRTTLHVKVVMSKEFRIRMWCGVQLIRLASHVMGIGVDFQQGEKHG